MCYACHMADYELAHPLYLDVQMMVSFLAYLEGGVHLSSEQTLQREKLRAGKPERDEVKLPSLGALLGLGASLDAEGSHPRGESTETKVARHHTAASLFNALYGFLYQDDAIQTLENKEQLASVATGAFVKLSGRYTGNPLEEMLAIFTQVMSYMGEISHSVEEARSQKSANRKSGNPQNRELAGQKGAPHPYAEMGEQFREFEQSIEMRFVRRMKEELESSPIHDVVLETASGVKAVLTVSSDYYDAAVAERLSSGDFVVLGKVTRVLREGESINLSRRTVVGKMEDVSDSVTDTMTNIPGFNLQSTEPFVRYPAVQILPMAIFV